MRIISGKYKSRRLQVPQKLLARPTTDFAKENLFNVLNNHIDWEKKVALDLFSGTGSIALELVSRGCAKVISVEKNQAHHNFIHKNKELLHADELQPIKADAFHFLQICTETFDLIFADPPYDLPDLERIPNLVFEHKLLCENGILIIEHSQKNDFSGVPFFVKKRKYGSVHFSIFEYLV